MLVELGAVGMFGPLMAFGSLATLFGEYDDEPDNFVHIHDNSVTLVFDDDIQIRAHKSDFFIKTV